MKIELTKESNTHHKLRCIRSDGSVEEAKLESKSLLIHDFTHLSLETEAGLKHSFWGLVADGKTFQILREEVDPENVDYKSELMQTEMIVGPLQSVVAGTRSVKELIGGLQNQFSAHDMEVPRFLSVELIERAKERFRQFIGEWNALPFGETMEVHWEVS